MFTKIVFISKMLRYEYPFTTDVAESLAAMAARILSKEKKYEF